MSRPNAFTAGPTLKWGGDKLKRPNLEPSKSGIILGPRSDPDVSKATGALIEAKKEVLDRWTRRAGKK